MKELVCECPCYAKVFPLNLKKETVRDQRNGLWGSVLSRKEVWGQAEAGDRKSLGTGSGWVERCGEREIQGESQLGVTWSVEWREENT